jgi:hypothetical protein
MLLSGLALDIGTADTGPFPIDKKEKEIYARRCELRRLATVGCWISR